jgi:RNA polymerase subunit RPABC4/transcription elongation factor Spt4
MRESIPNPCPKCGSTNIKQHWCNPDDHGLIIDIIINVKTADALPDSAIRQERWNTGTA